MCGHDFIKARWAALMMVLIPCTVLPSCRSADADKQMPPDQQKRLEAMRAMGTQARLTIFPVALSVTNKDEKDVKDIGKDVGQVLGVLLEKAGMENLETTDSVFVLAADVDFDGAAVAFGEFVRAKPIETDYALYAEVVGVTGNPVQIDEVRSVVVDRAGECVWIDRQTRVHADFKRIKPNSLMTSCVLLTERVRKQLGIPKSARNDSREGKFARMLAEDSPAPDKAEREAMAKRLAIMKKASPGVKVAVMPVRFSDERVATEDALQLAKLLHKQELCVVEVVDSSLRIKIQPSHNEQKLLWALARAFRDHVKQHPPDADYTLLADYMMGPGGRPWAVHFVICDREGEWVIVDFQNDHHGDFQSIDPQTPDDCGELVAKRMRGYLR